MSIQRIVCLRGDAPVRFAAGELRRGLRTATGLELDVRQRKRFGAGNGTIWLGIFPDVAGAVPADAGENPLDDRVIVNVGPNGGIIAGANPKSVLLGVYRYLTALGFRWVRPGRDGERCPKLSLPLPQVTFDETPSYRHRGVCIEGAVSLEHVLDTVDWMPKLGYNAYFIQFLEAYNFFQRWYEHEGNPTMASKPFAIEDARKFTAKVRDAVKQRGMDLHMVGHGWTCEPFGIPGPGWFQHEGPIPETAKPFLAEVNGKRELWGGIALNTNLCYGNPETRETITDAIVDYARENGDVDVIHFWLADGSNNQCECPLCCDHLPADMYVMMLNELDAKLTDAGLDTRIVFLVYVDLLWAPAQERIRNPDRFILMFAPITRSYSVPFAAGKGPPVTLPPYDRNKLQFPRDPQVNLAFLAAWQEQFRGDSFDFDYHFMWDHHKDPGQFAMAKILHEDMKRLQDTGLNGMVSCQNQRVFFPTGLGMTAMGRTLWDRDLTFNEIAADYFRATFGDQGPEVARYLERLSELFDPRLIRGEVDDAEKAAAPERLAQIPGIIDAMAETIKAGTQSEDGCMARSWRYLIFHAKLCRRLAEAMVSRYSGKEELAKQQAWKMFRWLRRQERYIHRVMDVFEFQVTLAPLFDISRNEILAR